MQKRLMLLVLSVFSCFILLSGCAGSSKTSETLDYQKETVMQSGSFFAKSWADGSLTDIVKEKLDNKSKKLILPMIENLDHVKVKILLNMKNTLSLKVEGLNLRLLLMKTV